jgi:hypothetical protein
MMITLVVSLFVLYGGIMWCYRNQGDLITGSLITALIICLIQDVMGQKAYIELINSWWTPAWISIPICTFFLASMIYDLERKRRLRKQISLREAVIKQWGTQIVNPVAFKGAQITASQIANEIEVALCTPVPFDNNAPKMREWIRQLRAIEIL